MIEAKIAGSSIATSQCCRKDTKSTWQSQLTRCNVERIAAATGRFYKLKRTSLTRSIRKPYPPRLNTSRKCHPLSLQKRETGSNSQALILGHTTTESTFETTSSRLHV